MKYKILFFLISLNLSAQNYKLEAISIASKNKKDISAKYSSWNRMKSSYFINIKEQTIETFNDQNDLNIIKILKRYKITKNRNGDELLKFDCRENGGDFKLYFIKYTKPRNEIAGEIVMNYDVSFDLFIYSVKVL